MNQTNQTNQTNQMNQDDEINLLDYWRVIKKRSKLILALFLVSVISAAVVSLYMTPIYEAKVTLMPIDSSQSRLSATLGSLQNIPFVGGLAKTASGTLIGILDSRTVAENVIRSLNLIGVLFEEQWDDKNKRWKGEKPPTLMNAVGTLKGMVKVGDDRKGGLISISVENKDPKLAADIANAYAAALQKFLNVNAISLVKRNRIFVEKQLEITREDLKKAEEALNRFQTKNKIVAMDAQAEGAIRAHADLKAQIISREVQLGALREFATSAHPDVKRVQDELRELRFQLKRLEEGSKNPRGEESIGSFLALADAPTVGLEFVRLKRDAMVQQKVFELLTQQYEMAKIEEAKDDITFQVIDPAIPPEKRIKPKRTQNVMLAGVVSLFLSVFLVFFLEYLEKQKSRQGEIGQRQ